MDYSTKIRELRTQQGIGIVRLAKAAGIAGSTLQLIEAGEANPTIETLRKIFSELGYDLQISAKKQRKIAAINPEK